MAYMVMLVLGNADQLDGVLAAWQTIQVDHVTYFDSACSHVRGRARPHIPLRFPFEGPSGATQASTVTVFVVVPDADTILRCTALAESVIGPFDSSPNAMLFAWPLETIAGYPKPPSDGGQD